MNDIEYAQSLVRGEWPITVEQYDSGTIGFCARPMINGRRFNRSFSSAKWATSEAAAKAAIEYCEEIARTYQSAKVATSARTLIPPNFLRHYESIHLEATQRGIDPIEAFRDGLKMKLEEATARLTLTQAIQRFLISLGQKGLKEGYKHDLKAFYSSFEIDFGTRTISDITQAEVTGWLDRRARQKVVMSPQTWNDWRRRLLQLWEFALRPENGWVAENIVEQIMKK